MKKVIQYQCDTTPTDEEIIEALYQARIDHAIIQVNWSTPLTGSHHVDVVEGMKKEDVRKIINEGGTNYGRR